MTVSGRVRLKAWWQANWRAPRTLAIVWLVSRVVLFSAWFAITRSVQGDVKYYWSRLDRLAQVGGSNILFEYPTPVIWVLQLPYLVVGGNRQGFIVAFITLLLLIDAAFAVLLWSFGGKHRASAVLAWTAFTALLGPTVYMRFDLIPAVLVGAALLVLARRRTALTGFLIGLGAALKLWPALLWPATLIGDRKQRVRTTIAFFVTGGTLAIASLAYAGFDRLLSPLSWQSDRGLQVESLWATVPMLTRAATEGNFGVAVSKYQAFEIAGPGVETWLLLASVANVLGLLFIGLLHVAWFRSGHRSPGEAGLLMLLVVTVLIATTNTFSPQYVLWLAGPMAALLAIAGEPHAEAGPIEWRTIRGLAWSLGGLTLITFLVYPVAYPALVHGGPWMGVATAALVLRNFGLVALLIWLIQIAYGILRPSLAAEPAFTRLSGRLRAVWRPEATRERED